MIRKAIIVVLTLGALGTAILGALSFIVEMDPPELHAGPTSFSSHITPTCRRCGNEFTGVCPATRTSTGLYWHVINNDYASAFFAVAEGQVGVFIWQSNDPRARPFMHGMEDTRIDTLRRGAAHWRDSYDRTSAFYFLQHHSMSTRFRFLEPGGLVQFVTTDVGLPAWSAFVLFAIYPTIAFIRGPLRCFRRRRKGLCLGCGYNLTGLTEPRCPECATESQVR